ncbi:MAG: hypothetical protein BGO55_05285 [Sphingobacteriales bacterium 50-39]|nr:hypothetical protein [Sphingobacteriales bacterium]OJW56020.1 MAG: hypothetical protein BGO55_05285 [Sphingobacteriales bacterium 50-39]
MKPIQLLLLSFILFSCSKSGNGPTPAPPNSTPTDTLGSWKVVGRIPIPGGINDIWFTSPSQGFTAVQDGYLYKSQDSGKTWTKIPNTYINSQDEAINLFFVGDTYGFAQGLSHLLVSQDGGNTWAIRTLPTYNASSEFFASPSTGYYGDINTGLYKTTDTGKTWTQGFHSSRSPVAYTTYFLDPGKGFLFCEDATFSKTVDSAVSWQQVQQNIFVTSNAPPAYNSLQFIDGQTGYYGWENGVLKTTDGGVSWNSVYPKGGKINVVKFFNATTGYYKSDKIIYKTTDGGQTWTTSARFISDDYFIGISFVGGATGWACTFKGLVLRIDHP